MTRWTQEALTEADRAWLDANMALAGVSRDAVDTSWVEYEQVGAGWWGLALWPLVLPVCLVVVLLLVG